MNEKHIRIIQKILTNWNPLGDRAENISDLNGYEIEATDILFHLKKPYSIDKIITLLINVLEEAFRLQISREEARPYAKHIYEAIKNK